MHEYDHSTSYLTTHTRNNRFNF